MGSCQTVSRSSVSEAQYIGDSKEISLEKYPKKARKSEPSTNQLDSGDRRPSASTTGASTFRVHKASISSFNPEIRDHKHKQQASTYTSKQDDRKLKDSNNLTAASNIIISPTTTASNDHYIIQQASGFNCKVPVLGDIGSSSLMRKRSYFNLAISAVNGANN